MEPPIERLAKLILKGDVVFFIGAGFSIDSEGNSARRMMRRLVLQLLAFVETGTQHADRLLDDFINKFNLDPDRLLQEAESHRTARIRWLTIGGLRSGERPDVELPVTKLQDPRYDVEWWLEHLPQDVSDRWLLRRLLRTLGDWPINRLARDYYQVNEWFCRAFETLLTACKEQGAEEHTFFLKAVHDNAESLRREMNSVLAALKEPEELAPMRAVAPWLLHDQLDRRIAGKALFLETLGFADQQIMGGVLGSAALDEVAASFHDRLFPRHHVLARFAREGWCPTLITTNFDLLLEGAYRLAGFAHGEQDGGSPRSGFPETLMASYDVVRSARDFFQKAKAFRTAVVVKIHGCAERYRTLAKAFEHLVGRADADVAELTHARQRLEDCVRTLVFTYREIQNWRGDSWAADYLRTVLRTRTVVFCGYSVSDPVIHDTFRSAFEEMARLTTVEAIASGESTNVLGSKTVGAPERAPLFFFDSADQRSFYSEAVLRAATEAVGQRANFMDHPNRVAFHFRGGRFPDLDENFRWLQHLTWRERQHECVTNHLARTAAMLANDGPFQQKRRSEIDMVERRMRGEFARERQGESPFQDDLSAAEARQRLDASTAWTERFHVALLREFACAEDVRRLRLPNVQVATIRRHEWYFPTMENATWTCWGLILEFALKTAGELCRCAVAVADCARPTVFFTPRHANGSVRTPWALTIEFAGVERAAAPARVLGIPWCRLIWTLQAKDMPWPVTDAGDGTRFEPTRGSSYVVYQDAPTASVLWTLAMGRDAFVAGRPDNEVAADLHRYFGPASGPVAHS